MIVKITGGLGNQMFQYAFGYALYKNNNQIKFDITSFENYELRSFELNYFNIGAELASKEEINLLKYKPEKMVFRVLRKFRRKPRVISQSYYKENDFTFDNKALSLKRKCYFDGYWQSEKYFLDYRDELLQKFILSKELEAKTRQYEILIGKNESVSVHIRRGDYISNEHTNSVHGTCSIDYYREAIDYIRNKSTSAKFFIFSDDLDWVKENLTFIENPCFIELGRNVPDSEEMYLMSQCQYNIIANSSFSWWGAWLNTNENKIVIAPKQWFNDPSVNTEDLIPNTWVRI